MIIYILNYFHPDDLEEALNYMAINNGIIQHRFVKDNRDINNKLCYICGEDSKIHLNFIGRSLRINRSSDSISDYNSNNDKINNNKNNINDIDYNITIKEKNNANNNDSNNIKNTNNQIDRNEKSNLNNNIKNEISDIKNNKNNSDSSSKSSLNNTINYNSNFNQKNIINNPKNIRENEIKIGNKRTINNNIEQNDVKEISVNINNQKIIPNNNVDFDFEEKYSSERNEMSSFDKTKNKIRFNSSFSSINEKENLYKKGSLKNPFKNPFQNNVIINELKIDNEIEEEKRECPICDEYFIVNKKNNIKNCGHAFCNECWYDSLKVKINENRLSTIKCLDYKCDSKLSDEFIINLLNSNVSLIKKYKKYKKEIEVINNPNKKLCPFPNCDSFLELKDIKQKYVTCENNHHYCFLCLKEPHEEKQCDEKIDKSILEYASNKFIKKCPQCSIITEKNGGCNHITCAKCQYQWCWLCNEKYESDHYYQGKCRGFQFFKPKNEYEIKLMMEGKIDPDELSFGQRQLDDDDSDDFDVESFDTILRFNPFRNRRFDSDDDFSSVSNSIQVNKEENNNQPNNQTIKMEDNIMKIEKILFKICSILFGYNFFIIRKYKSTNPIISLAYSLLIIPFFFPLLLLNIFSLILTLIFLGSKEFSKTIENNYHLYTKEAIVIIANFILGIFCRLFYKYKVVVHDTFILNNILENIITFFPCFIITFVILFPNILIYNFIYILFLSVKEGSWILLLLELDYKFELAFGFQIQKINNI